MRFTRLIPLLVLLAPFLGGWRFATAHRADATVQAPGAIVAKSSEGTSEGSGTNSPVKGVDPNGGGS